MAAETQYTANTRMVTMSVANSNLDGQGAYYTVLYSAANGTLVKTVTIKAQGDTTFGMVRLYVHDGTNNKLIAEVAIPATQFTAVSPSFGITIPVNFALKSGWSMKASTEKGEPINIIVEGLDWAYYTTSVRQDSVKYTANIGMVTISTANTNVDGTTGTYYDVITAASNGTLVKRINIKAQVTTTEGAVRLFLYDGTNTKLLTEVMVPALEKSSVVDSFSAVVNFDGEGFALKSGWKIKATTSKGENFDVIAEGLDWAYPA